MKSISSLIKQISNSTRVQSIGCRLSESLWVFILVLLLQMIVNTLFIQRSYGLLPEGLTEIVEVNIVGAWVRSLLRSLFWASILWWAYALVVKHKLLRLILGSLIVLVSLFVFGFEAFTLHRYGMVYSHSVIQVLSGTNPREAMEYIEASFSPAMLLPIVLVLSTLIWAITRYSRWAKGRYFRVTPILAGLMLPVVALVLLYSTPRTYEKIKMSGQAYDLTISPYDRVIWNTYGFVEESKAISEAVNTISNLDVGTIEQEQYIALPEQKELNVVVIVGETLRRDYMSCYGFPLKNTPHIDSILATGDMIAYTDVISPAPNTIESLTKVFTFQTNELGGKWYNYPALPKLFSQAGYWVDWVSNQESTGTFIQPLNTFAKLSDSYQYVNARSIDEEHDVTKNFYDEDVLPFLKDNAYSELNGKKGLLQIVHLMGSHPVYSKRFPKNYAKFTASDIPTKRSIDKDQVVSDYINSIYYNDYVVSRIINKYSGKTSIVFYFSDHGEIIYDDPNNPDYCDHGMLPQGVSVPFLVYLSPNLRANYPALYEQLQKYKDRKIMMDIFPQALSGLLGVKHKYSNPAYDFFSDSYNEERPRIVRSFSQELKM